MCGALTQSFAHLQRQTHSWFKGSSSSLSITEKNVSLSNGFQTASPLTSVGITRQISEDRYRVSTHLGQSRSSPNQGNVHIAECCFLKSSDGPLGQIIQPHRDLQMKHIFLCRFFNKHSSHCNARSRARILNCAENLMKTVIKENSFLKNKFIYLFVFIFGCVGSSLLCVGFL